MNCEEDNNSVLESDDSDYIGEENGETAQKSRKRKKCASLWKQNIRKHKRNKGKGYTAKSGIWVPARTYGSCTCKRRCTEKFDAETKETILINFNDLAEKNIQDVYLFGLISVHPVKRRRPEQRLVRFLAAGNPLPDNLSGMPESNRNRIFHYKVQVNGKDYSVCKMALCALHGIKKGRLDRLSVGKSHLDTPPLDGRGKSIGSRCRKKSDEFVEPYTQSGTFERHF